ncbi:MAG: circadian phase modifier CpmA, partial [Proteobacteria bacterium]|nr:circadian phase modifier CpmA [Pseudomonadota bacterium]
MSVIKDVNLDFDRERRTGLAEAVFCQGKSINQLRTICDTIVKEQKPMLFTRLSDSQHRQLEESHSGLLSYDEISKTAFFLTGNAGTAVPVAVVSGGSSDLSVAREASRTLAFYGHEVLEIHDVGVAGLWRMTERLEELRGCKIIICVAGMDAALPTVLGGLVSA